MNKDKRNVKHFNEKKKHTFLKHRILSETLAISLSIANMKSKNSNSSYVYIDLFAGTGKFKDDNFGSPIIAMDKFNLHLNTKVGNNFEKLIFLAIEKDKGNFECLKSSLKKYQSNDHIEILTINEEWKNCGEKLSSLLRKSKWGFIFADPFSTELKMNDFIEAVKNYGEFKDILILMNLNTLKRQEGRHHPNDIKRVCDVLGINEEKINNMDKSFEELFQQTIEEKYSNYLNKKFVVGVGIPIDVQNKLVDMDFFYLILVSSCVKVVDAFLEAYSKEFEGDSQYNLFPIGLSKDIIDTLTLFKKKKKGNISFFDLISVAMNTFVSWKYTKGKKEMIDAIPTIKNIVHSLNELKKENKIIIECKDDYLYKRDAENGKKGELNFNNLKNNKDFSSVYLDLV